MFLEKDKYDYKIFFIDHEYEEDKYLNRLNEEWDIIISVGGDGTLLELGQKIIDRNLCLGIIPIGSGNGLATHLGYKPRDIEGAFKAINNAEVKAIDVAQMGDEYFFSNFGIGIDAVVAKDFKIKKKRSLFVYGYLTLKRLINIQSYKIRFKTAEEEKEVESYLFNVFNSNLFGYNVGLIPWASAFDGKLDVVYLRKISFWKMPWACFSILIKKPQLCKDILFFETEEITIYNKGKMNFQIDGDPKRTDRDIHIKVLPSKLKMIVP